MYILFSVVNILFGRACAKGINGEFKTMRKNSLIVAIEGIDGAGKTTLITSLKQELGDKVCVYNRTQKGKLVDSLLNHFPLRNSRTLQIPVYFFLSYINYIKFKKQNHAPILVMDRCFLSNICYYYPMAMDNKLLFKFVMLFEVKLNPKEIFIIDEDAVIAHKRDKMKKDLEWLIQTRSNYLKSPQAPALTSYKINIIQSNIPLKDKKEIIIKRLYELRRKK